MKKRVFMAVALLLSAWMPMMACTNMIVGKKASTDGSVMVTYNDDAGSKFGHICHFPASTHVPGEMRKIYDWETKRYLGEIPEAPLTYNVVGNINEFQLCICETTFGGRRELYGSNGILDYGSLIYIALQRCKTAREAIKLITDLVDQYGYASGGESFSICDKEEAWIMELIGKGKDEKGSVWVAVRIPDDCISAHANQSRITTFPQTKKLDKALGCYKPNEDVMYSKDVITFARAKGWFDGKDEDFSFRDAYHPLNAGTTRSCDGRVWSIFNRFDHEGMQQYLPYIMGDMSAASMPLYIKPVKPLTVRDVKNAMRDHYEDTPLDSRNDISAGPWGTPYHAGLGFKDSKGNNYFSERPIATQQTAFALVAQLRSWLPDEVGGLMWFGADDPAMVAYTPVYCCTNQVPLAYTKKVGDTAHFSMDSAYWLSNVIANIVYNRWSIMIGDLQLAQKELDDRFEAEQAEVEKKALAMNQTERREWLTKMTETYCNQMMERWTNLFGYLAIKYNDFAIRKEKSYGEFETISDEKTRTTRIAYPQYFLDAVANETGDRYVRKAATHESQGDR